MIPAYIQIHDQIKAEIDQKIWKIGQRLPSERDLAEKVPGESDDPPSSHHSLGRRRSTGAS